MAAQSVERPLPPDPLPSSVVDSHCHLDMCAADGGPTVQEALAAAAEVGVTKMIQVGCDVQGSRWAAKVASEYDDIWAAVALHPNEAPKDPCQRRSHAAGGRLARDRRTGRTAAGARDR
ncbi:MAG: TatD family hydrolase [Candidatus Nanopelagicales bacterium]